jgi:hypothetical protein
LGNAYYEKYVKAYQQTPKGKFITQRANAKRRGVAWELTFEQWWQIWQESGKWEQRGTDSKQYCMARIHDEGPYAIGNVSIRTMRSNGTESYRHGLGLK